MDDDFTGLLQNYIDGEGGRELFVFSGSIDETAVGAMQDVVEPLANQEKDASLFLTTFGGDAHAAYRLTRCLHSCFRETRLLLVGDCKSAGTLVAIGAQELAFGPRGELGPLDVQVRKPDEFYGSSSGLDILQAVRSVTELAEAAFASYVVNLAASGISTRTASEIASNLAGKLFEPISAQIDPLRLGEAERAMRIAREYGKRLGSDQRLVEGGLDRLVESYPSHETVIDVEEAGKIFKNVTEMTECERRIADYWGPVVSSPASPRPITFAGRMAYAQNAPTGGGTLTNGNTTNGGSGNPETIAGGDSGQTSAGSDSDHDPSSSASEEQGAQDEQSSG
ncbi:MAG: SppA protein [Chloroflexi bacterium]|nr:SppA protein [Chloroflexota bacterium]